VPDLGIDVARHHGRPDRCPAALGAGLRFLLATLLVGLVLAARVKRLLITRDDKICVLSLGLLVFWLDYAAVYWAKTRIASGLTAILFSRCRWQRVPP